jgi:peptidoglycan/LPS O-acetylase OafA/YrhL
MSPRQTALRFIAGRPLSDCIAAGRDNILTLRLLAALLVVFGHSYVVAPDASLADPLNRLLPRTHMHIVGVMMFFCISGFLITLSWLRRPELLRFLRARVLRLWPALILCVFAWAFVFGPLLSDESARTYFASGDVYAYAFGNASLFRLQWTLPGVFTSDPVPHVVNASLWTIPVEAALYLCVAAVGMLGLFRFRWLLSLGIASAFVALVLLPMYAGFAGALRIEWLGAVLAGFFGAGSIACLLSRHVPISTPLMLLLVLACGFARTTALEAPLVSLAICYFVLWFAYVPRIPAMPRGFDLSYGTYLWALPLQQTLVAAGVRDPLALFAIATPIVLLIAALSWTFVEKPALRLKDDMRWRRHIATESA